MIWAHFWRREVGPKAKWRSQSQEYFTELGAFNHSFLQGFGTQCLHLAFPQMGKIVHVLPKKHMCQNKKDENICPANMLSFLYQSHWRKLGLWMNESFWFISWFDSNLIGLGRKFKGFVTMLFDPWHFLVLQALRQWESEYQAWCGPKNKNSLNKKINMM